jgi:hypothetical protein
MSSLLEITQAIQESRPAIVPARLAFVTSTPLTVSEGSGTYVGIRELARYLEERRVRITTYAPTFWSPSFTLKRLLFNVLIAKRLRVEPHDWVVGFDLDGFHYGRRPVAPYIASIKGVIADELKNERGFVRVMLGLQAAFERLAVRRARVVVATSRYSRDRIVEAYGIPAAKVVLVPELIDIREWEAERETTAGREADPPAVLTVAHMYPRKNLPVLLRAYARLHGTACRSKGGSSVTDRVAANGSVCGTTCRSAGTSSSWGPFLDESWRNGIGGPPSFACRVARRDSGSSSSRPWPTPSRSWQPGPQPFPRPSPTGRWASLPIQMTLTLSRRVWRRS